MAPKIVYLIRHAEAAHNVGRDLSIPDPYLTPKGLAQAKTIPEVYAKPLFSRLVPHETEILCSPFNRTVQTLINGFDRYVSEKERRSLSSQPERYIRDNGTKVTLLPQLQECGPYPCDVGSDVAEKINNIAFDKPYLDWSLCVEGWNGKRGLYSSEKEILRLRAYWVRKYLEKIDTPAVIIISHNGFLKYLEQHFTGVHNEWRNIELRTLVWDQLDLPKDSELRARVEDEGLSEWF